ncbi:iron transporter [Sphingomonas sp. So64.6b]|uniref:iron transporter n=1 Tax=Sphingomonas sp. So64.6b TaxID=2997354 RepID=UPI001600667C|nr:iron transporter [Sphingomonas sp. So64.6b]QNA83387.1 iron transporter [Sphingomonas sp. So64.6b]
MKAAISIRYRLGVLVRVLAGVFGGYAFAAALAYTLARALPMARSEATTAATLIGVLAMPAAVIWIFAVVSARRALAGIVIVTLLVAAAGWLLGAPA